MLKWEADLGKPFTVPQWHKAIRWAHTSLAYANHTEQYQKLLTRWYFTPLRLAKAYTTASPYCWRYCRSIGSLLHIFWSCATLQPFWNNIFALISSIGQQQCPRSPEFALLLIGIESISLTSRVITYYILYVARLTITRNWKSITPPSLVEVNMIVSNICTH